MLVRPVQARLAATPRVVGGLLLCSALLLASCGDDADRADDEERVRLADSLGFLGADLGLTEAEVACTARTVEERLTGDDLDAFTAQVRRVDAGEVALDELPDDAGPVLTDAVAACTGRA